MHVGIVGERRKHLPVEAFCFGERSRLMIGYSPPKQIDDGFCGCHIGAAPERALPGFIRLPLVPVHCVIAYLIKPFSLC